jgi:hypothetical protein
VERDPQQQFVKPSDGLVVAGMARPKLLDPSVGLLIVSGSGGGVRLLGHLVAC